MSEIKYVGELLWPAQVGQFAIILGFVASLLSASAYFFAAQRRGKEDFLGWQNIGRLGFLVHGISVLTVIGLIFYLMLSHRYEYQYVQAHTSDDLPFRYVFSAFWQGQEGSFLLWMFWHIVLGMVLIFFAKQWEAPTLATLALIQAFLGSMLLGVYITEDIKIGSNPLLLLRDTMNIPLFNNAEYVQLIKGNGLNPALQNYWMTIHPPTLFLGFASTAIPFCYAIAGLWTNQHKAWLKPALKWALFSAGILGTGILMGGAWAYEALNFGGYWAWDPVENASLVPWLLLVAGVHANLISNATGYSMRTAYLFYILTFVFILYSTFLTRSGILGETSVHAFTEMGLEWQLVAFTGSFLLLGLGLLVAKGKGIPSAPKEESLASKEFWMFMGTLVLLFSAVLIIGSTSLPIYNKIRQIFDPTFAGLVIDKPIPHYNKYQIWIAVFMGILSGTAQFLRYKEFNFQKYSLKFGIHLGTALLISIPLTYLATLWIDATAWQYIILLGAGIFTVVCNLQYLVAVTRTNKKMVGSVLSHVGFGVMIVGILASGLNKTYLSHNEFAMRGLLDEEMIEKNIILQKGDPIFMNGYEVTYVKDTMESFTRTFQINMKYKGKSEQVQQEFNLYPSLLYDRELTKIANINPDTKHYLGKDIFTHIANVPRVELDVEYAKEVEAGLNYKFYEVKLGAVFDINDTITIKDEKRGLDTSVVRRYRGQLIGIDKQPKHPDYHAEKGDIALGAVVRIQDRDSIYIARPMLALRGQVLYGYPDQINRLTTKVKLNEGIFDLMLADDASLGYQVYHLKQGDKIQFKEYQIQFSGFNKSPQHPNYYAQEGDIAVGAMFDINKGNQHYKAQPVYFIRESRPFNLKDEVLEEGIHIRFNSINPKEESIEVMIGQNANIHAGIPVEIATNSARTDFIVFEAIEFQGINLFWIGSILMLFGLFFSMWYRMQQKQKMVAA